MATATKTPASDPAEKKTDAGGSKDTGAKISIDYKAMTLAQKFALLREACPEIVKRQHSDGVKYKFRKIFDVYELLAPAMVKYGVDWEIVKEKPPGTTRTEDAMYWDTYTQHTRNGDRVVWVYEADLTLRWVNVADTNDTQEVKLHAIGTNDGGPDKAKGSAWTYCLKYYLFEKFNIDQGEDDPDMSDHSSEPQQNAQNGIQSSGQPQGGQTYQQKQNGAQNGSQGQRRAAGLSEAQMNRLYKKAEACGMTKEKTDARIHEKYGHTNPAGMTRAQYDEICGALDAAAAKSQYEQGGNRHAE
jgi:hypothetical protein